LTYFLQGLGALLVVFSLFPLIRHDHWTFRVFEYPRAQKFILTLLVLLLILTLATPTSTLEWAFAGALVLNLGYLFYQLFPYTVLAGVQVKRLAGDHPDRIIKLLICNVYQYNRQAPRLLALIKTTHPDLILLAETDAWWASQAQELKTEYPHFVEIPLENTYGMLLYSRLELLDPQVKYLVESDIPSIHTQLKLPSGEPVQLFCLHPTPPVPQENPRSTERDKEILLVGKLAKASPIPVIVAGDLNDVAWSYSTDLFQKSSGLLDPRRGRGFFNTFHAWYPWLRFPLDHIFCSNDFKLSLLRRLPAVGSDHFPMLVGLVYDPQAPAEQPEPEADAEERETVEKKIAAATGDNPSPQAEKNPSGT